MTTPEIRFDCPDEMKFEVVRRVRRRHCKARYKTIDVDGVRAIFPQGWGLVRASNTQPVLVMRFEAATPELLAQYRTEVEEVVSAAKAAASSPPFLQELRFTDRVRPSGSN